MFIMHKSHLLVSSLLLLTVDVVMTATKRGNESVIRIERIAKNEVNYNDVYHVAGGPMRGIIINRAKQGRVHIFILFLTKTYESKIQ